MKDQLQERLKQLQSEYEAGQKMLADLEAKRVQLTQTLLRIEGAMQVIREILAPETDSPSAEKSS